MIKENHVSESTPTYTTRDEDVPLNKVKLNPQQRIRQETGNYKLDPGFIATKESMGKIGQLHPITLNSNYKLLAGYIRFLVAYDSGWESIRAKIYSNLSEFDELYIEFIENNNRKNFTSYEFYLGLGKLKKKYEKTYPETKKGKYIRKSPEIQDHKTINASDALMFSSPGAFVEKYYKDFGIAKRTMFVKTRIAEAILNNKLDEKSIHLIKEGNITQTELLDRLRKIENRMIIKKKLKGRFDISTNSIEDADKNDTSLPATELQQIENVHNKIKTVENTIKEESGKQFMEAGKNYMRKMKQKCKPDTVKKESQKSSKIKPKDISCSKDKDELTITQLKEKDTKLCCYYCSHVRITRCLKCEKNCSTLKCSKGNEIKFKNKCKDFAP
ncbi:MAG: ParB/RepB/Spo0J family partition protein [Candidatus Thorarchaeota archaeon]